MLDVVNADAPVPTAFLLFVAVARVVTVILVERDGVSSGDFVTTKALG